MPEDAHSSQEEKHSHPHSRRKEPTETGQQSGIGGGTSHWVKGLV